MQHAPLKTRLGTLYPQLSDQELMQAEENFRRYIVVTLRIHQRLSQKGVVPDLTGSKKDGAMEVAGLSTGLSDRNST